MTGYPHDAFADQAQNAADRIASLLTEWLEPRAVLDVGCGLGVWLHAWRSNGVAVVMGVDGDYIDRSALRVPEENFVAADLEQSLDLGRRFDLVTSLEVAEHIDEAYADTFIDSLVRHGDAVLFSAAIPFQGGVHHVNCQWPSYWSEKFAARGFETLDIIRPHVWDDPDIAWWYRQNTLLYARNEALARLHNVPSSASPLDVVHPQWYLDMRPEPTIRETWRPFYGALKRRGYALLNLDS